MTISIFGKFTFDDHQDFRHSYDDTEDQPVNYTIDMRAAGHTDSSALGMLLLLREHAGGDDARIRITNCRPELLELFRVANFNGLFTIE